MKLLGFFSFLAFAISANAGLLFNTGIGNAVTSRPQNGSFEGIGTKVQVATNTTLTNIAMDLDMPNGGTIKYMIWDSTDTNLLFSSTQAVGASSSPEIDPLLHDGSRLADFFYVGGR